MKSVWYRSYLYPMYMVGICFGTYTFWQVKQYVFFVHTVTCTVSGASCALLNEIESFVHLRKMQGAYSIVHSLMHTFPIIDEVYVKRTVDQRLWCDAKVKDIAYCINKEKVVDHFGVFHDARLFDHTLVAAARQCIVNEHFLERTVSSALLQALNAIDDFFFTYYTLYIVDKHHSFLVPKDTAMQYSVCFETGKIPQKKLIEEAVNQLPTVIRDKRMNEQKKKRTVIDIRFAHQLIFYKEKKEIV